MSVVVGNPVHGYEEVSVINDNIAQSSTCLSVPVFNCARCGKNHDTLDFQPFMRPVMKNETEVDATHWAMCPTTQQPILLLQARAA